MADRKKRLVFISKGNAQFVKADRKFLSDHFRISSFIFPDKKGIYYLMPYVRFLLFCLWQIPRSSYCYIWFADYHTLVPTLLTRIFSVKCLLIIGGYDAAKLPQYSYGAHRSRIRSKCIDFSCRLSSDVIVVSKFVEDNLRKNTSGKFSATLVYNALKANKQSDISQHEKKYVCTVCPSEKVYRYHIKGIDIFLQISKSLPDLQFLIIGPTGKLLEKILEEKPDNLTVKPKLPHKKFLKLLKQVKIICQFSRYESFGMSMLEGMQMGALPMCSNDIGSAEIVPQEEKYIVNVSLMDKVIANVKANHIMEYDPIYFANYVNSKFNQEERMERILALLRSR